MGTPKHICTDLFSSWMEMYRQGCVWGIFVSFSAFPSALTATFAANGPSQVNMTAEERCKDNYVAATGEMSGWARGRDLVLAAALGRTTLCLFPMRTWNLTPIWYRERGRESIDCSSLLFDEELKGSQGRGNQAAVLQDILVSQLNTLQQKVEFFRKWGNSVLLGNLAFCDGKWKRSADLEFKVSIRQKWKSKWMGLTGQGQSQSL